MQRLPSVTRSTQWWRSPTHRVEQQVPTQVEIQVQSQVQTQTQVQVEDPNLLPIVDIDAYMPLTRFDSIPPAYHQKR